MSPHVNEDASACPNPANPRTRGTHEHITHVGNSGNNWRLTKEDAISRINNKSASFYTLERNTGKQMFIGVVRETGKAPYLRTHSDGVWNDNLLAQSTCGANCKLL